MPLLLRYCWAATENLGLLYNFYEALERVLDTEPAVPRHNSTLGLTDLSQNILAVSIDLVYALLFAQPGVVLINGLDIFEYGSKLQALLCAHFEY